MLTENELKILYIVNERGLVRISEIYTIFENEKETAVKVAKALSDRGLLKTFLPLGETSFAITKSGMKFLNGKA